MMLQSEEVGSVTFWSQDAARVRRGLQRMQRLRDDQASWSPVADPVATLSHYSNSAQLERSIWLLGGVQMKRELRRRIDNWALSGHLATRVLDLYNIDLGNAEPLHSDSHTRPLVMHGILRDASGQTYGDEEDYNNDVGSPATEEVRVTMRAYDIEAIMTGSRGRSTRTILCELSNHISIGVVLNQLSLAFGHVATPHFNLLIDYFLGPGKLDDSSSTAERLKPRPPPSRRSPSNASGETGSESDTDENAASCSNSANEEGTPSPLRYARRDEHKRFNVDIDTRYLYIVTQRAELSFASQLPAIGLRELGSILFQVLYSLHVAWLGLGWVHGDFHVGNLRLRQQSGNDMLADRTWSYMLEADNLNTLYSITPRQHSGLFASIIDFGRSRAWARTFVETATLSASEASSSEDDDDDDDDDSRSISSQRDNETATFENHTVEGEPLLLGCERAPTMSMYNPNPDDDPRYLALTLVFHYDFSRAAASLIREAQTRSADDPKGEVERAIKYVNDMRVLLAVMMDLPRFLNDLAHDKELHDMAELTEMQRTELRALYATTVEVNRNMRYTHASLLVMFESFERFISPRATLMEHVATVYVHRLHRHRVPMRNTTTSTTTGSQHANMPRTTTSVCLALPVFDQYREQAQKQIAEKEDIFLVGSMPRESLLLRNPWRGESNMTRATEQSRDNLTCRQFERLDASGVEEENRR